MAQSTSKGKAETTDAEEKVAASFFVPESTRDNYLQMARDTAALNGGSATSALRKLAETFENSHKVDPTGGWNHLAEWAKTADPDATAGPSALALATARAVESATRDPQAFLQGQPVVLDAAVESVRNQGTTDSPIEGVGVSTTVSVAPHVTGTTGD